MSRGALGSCVSSKVSGPDREMEFLPSAFLEILPLGIALPFASRADARVGVARNTSDHYISRAVETQVACRFAATVLLTTCLEVCRDGASRGSLGVTFVAYHAE